MGLSELDLDQRPLCLNQSWSFWEAAMGREGTGCESFQVQLKAASLANPSTFKDRTSLAELQQAFQRTTPPPSRAQRRCKAAEPNGISCPGPHLASGGENNQFKESRRGLQEGLQVWAALKARAHPIPRVKHFATGLRLVKNTLRDSGLHSLTRERSWTAALRRRTYALS